MTMTDILLAAKAEGISYGQYVARRRPHTTFAELEDAQIANRQRFEDNAVAGIPGISHTCEYCGKVFISTSVKVRFCSKLCGQRAYNAKKYEHEKLCAFCGKSFKTNQSCKKCCSAECSREHKKQYMAERQKRLQAAKEPRRCDICGAPMPGAARAQKYCSEECRQESARRRGEQLETSR